MIDEVTKILVLRFSLRSVEGNRLENRFRHFGLVGGMEWNAPFRHERGSSSKFRKHEDTMTFLLAGYIFEGDKVHAITSGCEKAGISNRI